MRIGFTWALVTIECVCGVALIVASQTMTGLNVDMGGISLGSHTEVYVLNGVTLPAIRYRDGIL